MAIYPVRDFDEFRTQFATTEARRAELGVLATAVHRSVDNPNEVMVTFDMRSAEDAVALVELFGGAKVTERLGELRHEVEGLSIEWVTIPTEGGLSGRSIGDGRIRTTTGASVVAVIRGSTSFPGPGPEFVLEPGDVALVTGSADGVHLASVVMTGRGIA